MNKQVIDNIASNLAEDVFEIMRYDIIDRVVKDYSHIFEGLPLDEVGNAIMDETVKRMFLTQFARAAEEVTKHLR
jgi:hypothetical protein